MRKIIHVDMDCFFAAVEMRDNPALRDIPIAIGGGRERRGVISTANYPARKFGVRSTGGVGRRRSVLLLGHEVHAVAGRVAQGELPPPRLLADLGHGRPGGVPEVRGHDLRPLGVQLVQAAHPHPGQGVVRHHLVLDRADEQGHVVPDHTGEVVLHEVDRKSVV